MHCQTVRLLYGNNKLRVIGSDLFPLMKSYTSLIQEANLLTLQKQKNLEGWRTRNSWEVIKKSSLPPKAKK